MTMQTRPQALAALTELDDSTLLRGSSSEVVQKAYRLLSRIRWEGLVLRAPGTADTTKTTGFPILVAFSQSGTRGRQVKPGNNAIVVVNRLDGKGVWIVPMFPPATLKIPMAQDEGLDPPIEEADSTTTTVVERLDLKTLESLPWVAGQYVIRAINFDWLSNSVTTTLVGSPAARATEPVAPLMARGDVNATAKLPYFFKSKYSPELGTTEVALRVPSRPMAQSKAIPVFGAIRTHAPTHDIIHGSVILVRRNILRPIILALDIPVFPEDRKGSGGTVDLFFAYDLNTLITAPLPSAQYQVYLIAGEHIGGPYPLAVQ